MRNLYLTAVFIGCLWAVGLAYNVVMLDPGHGGPGGAKFGSNGDGAGSVGPNGLTEEWVNLQVALRTKFFIENDWFAMSPMLTRETDTTFRSLVDRVQYAKTYDALYFISMHHNGLGSTAQGTEVYWSSRLQDDSTNNRNAESRDSTLAKKLLLRISETWGYTNRCGTRSPSDWMAGCDEYQVGSLYVLRNINHCPVALSEASNIGTTSESSLFADEGSGHIGEEAGALFHGMHSHYNNMGFGRVSNRYIGGPGQSVGVDGVEWNTPVEFTWEYGEQHELIAWPNFYFNGNTYSFHHWAHLSCNDCFIDSFHTSRYYDVTIPYEFEEHIYRAYFTGGPYYCEVEAVPFPYRYALNDTVRFHWWTSSGVDSTSQVSLYLDRQNGAQGYPELLAANVPWKQRGYLDWVVTGSGCEQCRLKVVSNDIAGNTASEVAASWNTFSVCTWKVGDANGDGEWAITDAQYILRIIYESGPPPVPHPIGSGDANCSGGLSISDAVYIIAYIFGGGPEPGSTCSCTDFD